MTLKQLFDDDSAVSPVIGVILMVAITVILAAVIGTFVLDLGSNVKANPQAGVSVDTSGGSPYTVTLTSLNNADSVECVNGGSTDGNSASSVGSTFQCAKGSNIIAKKDGNKAVIRTDI